MEKAIKLIEEMVNEEQVITPQEHEKHMANLKPEINNLLYQFLPDDITLKETELLAMVINDIVWNPRKYLKNK